MTRLLWSVAIGFVLLAAGPQTLFGQVRLASGFGERNVRGQRIFVHVTVAVPPGLDGKSVAEDAARGQGARPIVSAAFSLTGLDWNNSPNGSMNPPQYQSLSEDLNSESNVGALNASQTTWNNVGTSEFLR